MLTLVGFPYAPDKTLTQAYNERLDSAGGANVNGYIYIYLDSMRTLRFSLISAPRSTDNSLKLNKLSNNKKHHRGTHKKN